MDLQRSKKLASQCIAAAKIAWEDNFSKNKDSGDNNRAAIGMIAVHLLADQLMNERMPVANVVGGSELNGTCEETNRLGGPGKSRKITPKPIREAAETVKMTTEEKEVE